MLTAQGTRGTHTFHFLIGNLLDTKPVGLYIHSPKTDLSVPAWDWQVHWIKLYFKIESEANTVFHMVTKQNAQLKSTMPKIPNWEVTDPLGNLIRNPNATETQQQAESPWLITIRTQTRPRLAYALRCRGY